jgi:hypothetical protein
MPGGGAGREMAKEMPMIACFIRYEIEPYDHDKFEAYARGWNGAIARCGATPIGYFTPHEGSLTTAYGAYLIPSLAAYEEYKRKMALDRDAQENRDFAKRDRFIRREDRIFLKLVPGSDGK